MLVKHHMGKSKKRLTVAIVVVLAFTLCAGIVTYALITGIDTEGRYDYSGCNDCSINIKRFLNTTDFFVEYTPVEFHYNPEETYEKRRQAFIHSAPWMCEMCVQYYSLPREWHTSEPQ